MEKLMRVGNLRMTDLTFLAKTDTGVFLFLEKAR